MSFNKFIQKFKQNSETNQTHLSFKGGKYNVPEHESVEFYKKYYENLGKEKMYIIEKITNENFKFFLDIEASKNGEGEIEDDGVLKIIEEIIKYYPKCDEYYVSKRELGRYHVNFPNVLVSCDEAKDILVKIKESENVNDELYKCIDQSVYRTGLRLYGSFKNENEENCYKLYDLKKGNYIDEEITFPTFLKMSIRTWQKIKNTTEKKEKEIVVKGITEEIIITQIKELVNDVKFPEQYPVITIEKIYATQNKMGMFCYYISINEKYCPFKDREHSRNNSPIYLELNSKGIYIRCYDEECIKMKYPENGLSCDISKYSELYKSMTCRYWKNGKVITEEIRNLLEDSLNGSHYLIAKAIFHIYKDRFRVDEVGHPTWYEYNGIRWCKSHLLNILISEEIREYYNCIKVMNKTDEGENLKDFIIKSEEEKKNKRNELVDNVINKLQNVSFKNNVMQQLCYLYKNHDENFVNMLDENVNLICFNNGVYDFETHCFRKCKETDYLTYTTGYDYVEYDPESRHVKEIMEFLQKILPNEKVREYLLKVLGKTLVGKPEEKFYIWTGLTGANGKSTLINFLESTLGQYMTSVDVSLLTNKRASSSQASPDIIRLKGKRLLSFQEPEHNDRLRTGVMKQFSGNDTIVARELYKAPISFKLQGTMMMCCNDLPSISSTDGGTFRRIRVIEFNSKFCENPKKANEFPIDHKLKDKLKVWRPYFMSILIEYNKKLQIEGLCEPEEVKLATEKYKMDNDKFNEFFDLNVEESEDEFMSCKDIFNVLQNWWVENYPSNKIPDEREVKRALRVRYGQEKTKKIENKKVIGFEVKINTI